MRVTEGTLALGCRGTMRCREQKDLQLNDEAFGYLKEVVFTPAVYPMKFYRHRNSHPLELRVCLSQTPPKSKLLVGGLGVRRSYLLPPFTRTCLMDIQQRGVQWEGGAVDGGSII